MRRLESISILVLAAFSGLLVHEAAHGLAACLFGGRVAWLLLGPFQILPELSLVAWNGNFGSIAFNPPPEGFSNRQSGAIQFMGAAGTALSALAAAVLARFLDTGFFRRTLVALAILWPLDLLTYSTLPFLGLRHWGLFGGARPEPYEGAMGMGIPPAIYFAFLGLYAVGIYSLVFRSFRSAKRSL